MYEPIENTDLIDSNSWAIWVTGSPWQTWPLIKFNQIWINNKDAIADATGAGDVVTQLNVLLARLREIWMLNT